jgi:FkbM family methyltransferase
MKYSQNNEEIIIGAYFGEFVGHLLSLGENDGVTLSNSRFLIEKGWSADLVEPSPSVFSKLQALYTDNPKIKSHNIAVGNSKGRMPFYDSGTLLKTGDQALVSTLSTAETQRWGNSVEFSEIEVNVITVPDLLENTLAGQFHFVSIDCEGLDLDILRQMDLNAMGTRCVCVEFNGKDELSYWNCVQQFGFRILHKNMENLIYVK